MIFVLILKNSRSALMFVVVFRFRVASLSGWNSGELLNSRHHLTHFKYTVTIIPSISVAIASQSW